MNDVVPLDRGLDRATHGRLPPQALDAERSVLGGILLDNDALDDVVVLIRGEDFYREAHRKIFEAMVSIAQKSEPIDRVTLKTELESSGSYEAVGGEDFVDLLDKVVPSASNLAYYAQIVREKAQLRRLIEASHKTSSDAYEQHGDVAELVDEAERRIYAVRGDEIRGTSQAIRDGVKDAFKRIESRYEKRGLVTGVPSGLDGLDHKTTGFHPGQLVVLGARPSMGKTSFGLDCLRSACKVDNGAGVFFSIETPKEDVVERLLAQEGRINGQHLRTGRVEDHEWPKLATASSTLAEMALEIVDDPHATALDIRAGARRLAKKFAAKGRKLLLVVVDYLQILRPFRERDRRDLEIADATGALKALAKDLGCTVMALSQLNRDLEKRNDKRPTLADLRESGSLEQDGDVVIFLYRDEVYNRDTEEHGIAEVIVGKQRNGPIGGVKVAWSDESTTFGNLAPKSAPAQRSFLDNEPPPLDRENP